MLDLDWPLGQQQLDIGSLSSAMSLEPKAPSKSKGCVQLRDDCDLLGIYFPDHPGLRSLSPLFSELEKLQTLDLRGTEVEGDLATLSACKELQELYLSKTKISGNLEALENTTGLKVLMLAHIEVNGNLNALNINELRYLDLSYTKVKVELKALERATKSFSLQLSHSQVTGDLKSLEKATKLSFLDISGTTLGGDGLELKFNSLHTFNASGCHFYGTFDAWALPSLETLDLSFNEISLVSSIPSACRNLILAGNGEVSFRPGLLARLIMNRIFVNLGDVSLPEAAPCRVLETRLFGNSVILVKHGLRMPWMFWTVAV